MNLIQIENGGLYCVLDTDARGKVRLIHFSCIPFDETGYSRENYHKYYTLAELHTVGGDINDHHGSRYTYTSPGADMRYESHSLARTEAGQRLEIRQTAGTLSLVTYIQFYDGLPAARFCNRVENHGSEAVTLDYITSFVYYGLSGGAEHCWDTEGLLYIPHNTWHGEVQWRRSAVGELGLSRLNRSSLKRLAYMQVGSWSSSEYLPLAVYENRLRGECLFWQIEHNGSWYWETGDVPDGGLYIQAGGPNATQHHFWKTLEPGESFTGVCVSAGAAAGGFDGAIGVLTGCRRRIRRPNRDNEKLPVIFNDYMNCLMGDPSEERLLPLIDAAAEAGCEYFVIDAGWFSDRTGGDDAWWSSIGVWEESRRRFPRGLKYVTDRILSRGMIPGLWVELEGIGPDSPLAAELPEDWFFTLRGRRVKEHNRFPLDYRKAEVRGWAREIIDRLIRDYGVGYFKIDYNINAGIGTDHDCESPGLGLLEHNRAHLAWLDEVLADYPDLVIENCASGGMRMDYAMLSRLSLQSMSDQTDYRQYACIAAMAASAVTPEQAAVWSYPGSVNGDEEEAVFNMVNTMLGRVHQSGFLNRLPATALARVEEGIRCYKGIRDDLRGGVPVFPLGLVRLRAPWAASGLLCGETLYVSVWRLDSVEDTVELPLPCLRGRAARVECLYPQGLPVSFRYDEQKSALWVTMDRPYTARFFRLRVPAAEK